MFEIIDLRNNFMYYYDFYISAKEKSYAEAERKYFLSSGTLSRSVSKLEEILELKLVKTGNRGIQLTVDGERVLQKLDELFINNGIVKLINLENDLDVTLTIGATRNIADFNLSEKITKFTKKFPNVGIKIFTDSASNLNEYLINHKIDVLIDYIPNQNYSEKYDLEVKPISHFKTCFACSKEYHKKIKNEIFSIKDLNKYILVISGNSRRRQILDEFLLENNTTLKPKHLMPDSKLMAEYVINNDFIGYFIEDELDIYNLKKIEIQENTPNNYIGIIYPKNTINNIAKEFVNIVLENS